MKSQKDAATMNIKILIGVILAGFVTIGVTFWFIGQKNANRGGGSVMNLPAPESNFNNKISDKYKKVLAESDRKDAEIAEKTGNSAISTFLGDETNDDNKETTTVDVKPAPVQKLPERVVYTPPPQNNYSDTQRQNAMNMMGSLMEGWTVPSMGLQTTKRKEVKDTVEVASNENNNNTPEITGTVIIPKGKTCYAVLDSVVDTDYQGVLISATLLSCSANGVDYSGGTLFGTYQRNFDKVGVTFNMLNSNGKGFDINAIAIDEKSQQGILSGDVDHHYFARYVLPTLTAIATGWAEVGARENTVITTGINGTESTQGEIGDTTKWVTAGSKAGEALNKAVADDLNGREISVEIKPEPGTGIGIVFLADVLNKG